MLNFVTTKHWKLSAVYAWIETAQSSQVLLLAYHEQEEQGHQCSDVVDGDHFVVVGDVSEGLLAGEGDLHMAGGKCTSQGGNVQYEQGHTSVVK